MDAKRARDTNYYRKMGLLKDRASIPMTSELLSKSLFDRFLVRYIGQGIKIRVIHG